MGGCAGGGGLDFGGLVGLDGLEGKRGLPGSRGSGRGVCGLGGLGWAGVCGFRFAALGWTDWGAGGGSGSGGYGEGGGQAGGPGGAADGDGRCCRGCEDAVKGAEGIGEVRDVLGGAVLGKEIAGGEVAVEFVGECGFDVLKVVELVLEEVGDGAVLVEGGLGGAGTGMVVMGGLGFGGGS